MNLIDEIAAALRHLIEDPRFWKLDPYYQDAARAALNRYEQEQRKDNQQ